MKEINLGPWIPTASTTALTSGILRDYMWVFLFIFIKAVLKVGAHTIFTFKNAFIKDEFRLLIGDECGVYGVPKVNPYYLMLVNNPKINLERILKRQKLKAIIVDASNGPWNI